MAHTLLYLVQEAHMFFQHHIIEAMNVAVGSACWLGATLCGAIYAHRLNTARLSGKHWWVKILSGSRGVFSWNPNLPEE